MKVKELITRLLEKDMNSDVMISLDEEDPNDKSTSGYLFNVEEVRTFGAHTTELVFTDWRKK